MAQSLWLAVFESGLVDGPHNTDSFRLQLALLLRVPYQSDRLRAASPHFLIPVPLWILSPCHCQYGVGTMPKPKPLIGWMLALYTLLISLWYQQNYTDLSVSVAGSTDTGDTNEAIIGPRKSSPWIWKGYMPHCKVTDTPFHIQGCICHFVKWQIHPFISKGTNIWTIKEKVYF